MEPKKRLLASPVLVIGCSNSRDIDLAYRNVSENPITISAAKEGGTLRHYLTDPTYLALLDDTLAQMAEAPGAVWWPICIHVDQGEDTLQTAWADFLAVRDLLRLRPQLAHVPLFLSPYVGTQPACAIIHQSLMLQVVNLAVARNLAQRSFPDIPAASMPLADNCHFDILSENVGEAAQAFLGG